VKENERISKMEREIEEVKSQLLAIGPMRPGSITRQFNVCGKAGCRCKDPDNPQRHGPYHKLSYAHKGKFTTQFIREESLAEVQTQLANYKNFRLLTKRWVDLALTLAKLKLKIDD
jgi:hypothetical protein